MGIALKWQLLITNATTVFLFIFLKSKSVVAFAGLALPLDSNGKLVDGS